MEPLQTLVPSCRSMSPLRPGSLSGNDRKANSIFAISRSGQENTPPIHPNVQVHRTSPTSVAKRTLKKQTAPRNGENFSLIVPKAEGDASVKVVVRIRPDNGQEKLCPCIVRRISSDTLTVGDHMYSFDSIFDSGSSQEDVFSLVGVPLVKDLLAGFNNLVVSYGHSGTGKTYTMWGPPSAMVDGLCINSSQGIVPRIFHMLFSEIYKKEENSEEVQTNYQCRCSFLEIYNEQINDLLDPTQRNLLVRDDALNAFRVENLSEEYVNNFQDVTQLLVKGLSNRKVGATSVNSKSSRSHIIFTCVIESWCQGLSSNLISSSKTSRISFVDLAGIDSSKPEGFRRQSIQEERCIKQSLSKLGRLVNFLSDYTSLENDKAPHTDSCLTDVLRGTLGGNAKVTFVCTIFPDERYKSSTLSTIRFGGRAKLMKNKAIINEISEDDVNGLSDQIRQLKEELIRAKSCETSSFGNIDGYFNRHNTRESLNLLRRSLKRSLLLPSIDNDSEEDMDVDEEDVKELCVQLNNLHSSVEEQAKNVSCNHSISTLSSDKVADEESDNSLNLNRINDPESGCCSFLGNSELQEDCCSEAPKHENSSNLKAMFMENNQIQVISENSNDKVADEEESDNSLNLNRINDPESGCCSFLGNSELQEDCSEAPKHENSSNLKAMFMENNQIQVISENSSLCVQSPQLVEPVFCASPRVDNRLKKSTSPSLAFKNISSCSPKFGSEKQTVIKGHPILSSLQSNKVSPIESLAASLHRGLQIIDYHQRSSIANKSHAALSFEHLALISRQSGTEKVDAPVLCSACKSQVTDNGSCNLDMQIIQIDSNGGAVKEFKNEDTEVEDIKTSGDAKQRNIELETLCAEQAMKIKQLESQIDMCNKRVSEQSASLEQNPSAAKEYTNEGKASFAGGGNVRNENIADHGISLGSSEREALIEEIHCLRKHLKSSTCSSMNVSLLELVRNGSTPVKGEEFENEKQRWMESESRWISLTEELRMDLESNRRLAERKERELSLEKQCVAELDDALNRSIQGHARIIEHYAELQEKYHELLGKHRKVMNGIAEVKKAAAKAGPKGKGSAFAAALAAELATSRIEREKERTRLKEQNRILKLQLRDTAEAVHAAGELLVRLKEAEETVSVTKGKYGQAQQEIERLQRQVDKLKKKHTMEIATMKHYLAESRLPESALEPLYQHASESVDENKAPPPDDDLSWRSVFRPSYH